MDPRDLDLLCLYWQDSYFADCRVPFGYRNGNLLNGDLSIISIML